MNSQKEYILTILIQNLSYLFWGLISAREIADVNMEKNFVKVK
ncbi:hypothetical protein [Chryseobacterium sp. Marseille-Q8038]